MVDVIPAQKHPGCSANARDTRGGYKDYFVDGGLPAWHQSDLPITQEYFGNPPGSLPDIANLEIGISVEELVERKKQPNVLLVDARPSNEIIS